MSVNKIIALLSLLHGINSIQLPHVPTTIAPSLVPRTMSPDCGLNPNTWGQVSPTSPSGYANLCVQCRVNAYGSPMSFTYSDAVSRSIISHGVSPRDASVIQNYVGDNLSKSAATATTMASCIAACSQDMHCVSSTFKDGFCHLNAQDYVSNNYAAEPITDAYTNIFSEGDSSYCLICPNDKSCTMSPSGLPKRIIAARGPKACPSGLTACPLTSTSSFTSSTPFECLDVAEELTSCGGCTTLGQGIDCSGLKGVASSGCSEGVCKIFSCKAGYQYSPVYNICHKIHRGFKLTL